MINFNENLLAAMDIETTGLDPNYHDVVQVAVLPLEPYTLEPHPKYQPFYQNIRPKNPDRAEPIAMQVNGLDMEELLLCPSAEQVADALSEWFKGINLPLGKRLIPLCQNSPFDVAFMRQWLGIELYETIFARRGRDTMYTACAINDEHSYKGLALPFNGLGLKPLCQHFGIDISGHHDALADCIATARVYHALLRMEKP